MLEKAIEKRVCDYAKNKGLLVYKFTSPGTRAVPDRLFILPGGRVFFIEFKAPGRLQTPNQAREAYRLAHQGVTVYVINDEEDGTRVIDTEIKSANSN